VLVWKTRFKYCQAGYRKPVQSKTRLLDCYGIEQHSQATIPYLSYRYSNLLDHSHFDEN